MAETVETATGKEEEAKAEAASPVKDKTAKVENKSDKDSETELDKAEESVVPENEVAEEVDNEFEKDKKPDTEAAVNGGGDGDDVEEKEDVTEDKSHDDGDDDVVTLEDDGGKIPTVTIPDVVFFDSVSEEEKKYYEENIILPSKIESMKMQCTACFKQVNHLIANNLQRHPQLGVPICRSCINFYQDGDWEKDDEGSDIYCRWCGNGGEVLGCDKCKVHVFCKRCITRNCGRSKFAEINEADEWACFCCDPSQIYKERNLMLTLAKWSAQRKKLKKAGKKETPKKKEKEDKQEEKKRKREEAVKKKQAEEISKVENFIDENIHEAFDTLSIYQKCLEDERRKWIRARRSMTANNAATAAKSLRRIYEITRQNMELLDHSLVEGYKSVFPEESGRKLQFSTEPKSPAKRRTKEPRKDSGDDDIEVEGVVINGEAVFANGEAVEEGEGVFDPSMLCSVEITAGRDSDSTPTPTPQGPPRKKKKLGHPSLPSRPTSGPASARGQMRISNKFLKKKTPKKDKMSPIKMKGRKRKAPGDEIEEITLDDDDSVGYVSQSDIDLKVAKDLNKKQNKFIHGGGDDEDDDDFDSDVSLDC